MSKFRLPKSVRKFVRVYKGRIRRQISDREEAERQIRELLADIRKRYNKAYEKS